MRSLRAVPWLAVIAVLGVAVPAHAQGKSKHYSVSKDRAVSVTRTVLVEQGFEVVSIERVGTTEVVYYRAGNKGRGKGKGKVEKMVIRRVENRVIFEETPADILVGIDVRLRL